MRGGEGFRSAEALAGAGAEWLRAEARGTVGRGSPGDCPGFACLLRCAARAGNRPASCAQKP
jgi:hypothetical protein